jgi:hypothetical protein
MDQVLLHTRKGSTWRVEIKPAADVQAERNDLAGKITEIWKRRDKLDNPDDHNCQVGFDAFGDRYVKWHEIPCRWKRFPIDAEFDEGCDIELLKSYQSKHERLERLSDFIDCFKDPSTANGVFPLTTGGVLDSCIHDNK